MKIKRVNNSGTPVNLESLADIHRDECSSANFLNPEFEQRYGTVSDFLKEYAEDDPWLNLCVRWDVEKDEDGTGYHLRLAILQQRKGLFMPVWVDRVEETDLPQLLSFLHRHWEYLREIWKPVSEHGYEES
jgi:hypothetical protein